RDLEAVLPGPLDQPAEAGQRAELGMDLKVTTLLRPDRPGTAGALRAGLQSVVLAFAIGSTDGVDGRQVEDVEAHARDVGQARFQVLEGAVASGLRRARPGEALVPGRVARLQRIDLNDLAAVVDDRPLAIRVAAHQLSQLRVQPQPRARTARPGGKRAG